MRKLLPLTFAFCFFTFSFASDDCFPARPSPARFVNNFSSEFPDFLSADEERTLENKLDQFNKETSNQIVIVIVDDLCDYEPNQFSTMIGEKWGIGQGKFDNGVVVMIKPTGGSGQRKTYIAVGYGLEGAIPDITSKRIVENEIIPLFKEGNYFTALDGATTILISLAKNEFSYKEYQKNTDESFWTKGTFVFIFILIYILYIILYNVFKKNKKGQVISGSGTTFYSGGWSSFGGVGDSFSGGGGSSFGGGSFGGGGAGGSW